MKWTKYNYFFEYKSKFLLYNSLSNSFAELDNETFNLLQKLKQQECTDVEDCDLKTKLMDMKVFAENELDELNEIKYLTHMKRRNNNALILTINPTLHCNFACTYCFEEEREPIYMTDEGAHI